MTNDLRETKTTGALESFWTEGMPDIRFASLDKDIAADVVIVGAGVTGITTAYLLSGSGKKIAVIDDGFAGSGETGRTTAHLTAILDQRYSEISNMHGEHDAFLVYESHSKAIDLIESISKSENIDCDFERVDAYLFLHPTDHRDSLENEMEIASDIGIFAEFVDKACLPFNTGISLRFPKQAQFHPLKYLQGLANRAAKNGVQIFTRTKASKILSNGVRTESGHMIRAKHIVIATHSPVKGAQIFSKEVPFRTYVIASKIPKNSIEPGLYWDTGDQKSENHAYHYIRIQKEQSHDILIVGGEDHVTGRANEKECFDRLEKWARRHFPQIKTLDYKWSGQILEPSDKLAFIGRSPWHDFNLYIATGYSGNGMTYGTIAAMILCDIINEKENKWSAVYNPSRLNIKAAAQMVRDNLAPLKHLASGWIKGGNIDSIDELKTGEGGVMDRVAVYKDESGIHAFSAVCPHMGCITTWNSAEKTFDCPCHGSRFTAYGKMINGPAMNGLKPVDLHEDKGEKIERKTR